jgi:hypothetical protein
MKKLLFLSSFVFVATFSVLSCKTTKNNQEKTETKNSTPQSRNKIKETNSVNRIEHNTVNPEKLDSLKREKIKTKTER